MNPLGLYVREPWLYVLDWGSKRVIRISIQYPVSTRAYGKGEGQAPGEFINPTDVKVDSLYQVWVVDPPSGRVVVFDSTGHLQHMYTFKHLPTRIALTASTFAILPAVHTEPYLFYLYNLSGQLIKPFGALIAHPEEAMAFDGWLDSHGGSFFFAGYRVSRIARFDASGNMLFYRDMIERFPVPKVMVDARGGRRVDPGAPVAALNMNTDTTYLYVYTRTDANTRILDVYSQEDGAYLFSYPLPDSLRLSVMHGTSLYGIANDTLLVQYTWKSAP